MWCSQQTHNLSKLNLVLFSASLRNIIWKLAFTKDDAEIDLLTATHPNAALVQTCQQVHDEAAGIYAEACNQFWATGNFVLEVGSAGSDQQWLVKDTDIEKLNPKLDNRSLKLVRHLTICGLGSGSTYSFVNGVWRGAGGRVGGLGRKVCTIFSAQDCVYFVDPTDKESLAQVEAEREKLCPKWDGTLTHVGVANMVRWYRIVMVLDRALFKKED